MANVKALGQREEKLVCLLEYAISELEEWGSFEAVIELKANLAHVLNPDCDYAYDLSNGPDYDYSCSHDCDAEHCLLRKRTAGHA